MDRAEVGIDEFGPVAPYYDELMKGVPYRMWVAYYLLLLSMQEVKPKTILDVCCGTGTMCELLTDEGFQLEGFDLSVPMIDRARKKAADKGLDIRYEVQSAPDFDMGRTYDAAFSFFDSLNYITDPAAFAAVFDRVFGHLEPGGSWIFDLNTAYAFEADMFTQRKLSPRSRLRYDWKGHYDPGTRLIRVDMEFWVDGKPFVETHMQRAYDLWDVRQMLQQAGFVQVDVYHSYTLEPPRAKSDRIHFACRKPPLA